MINKFDLFVIGAGSGGVRAARVASEKGMKVGIAEGWDLGGTCVNRGCVPKKLYSFSSHMKDELDLMSSYGWSVIKKKFSWRKLVNNKKKELLRLNNIYNSILKNSGVSIFNEFAKFIGKNELLVGRKKIFAKKILLSVGTTPRKLNFSAANEIISSDQAFDISRLPKKILILGGGYIAVEFASIFNDLGVDTTICIRGKKILTGFDNDIVDELMGQMTSKGIKFIVENFPKKIEKDGKFFRVSLKNTNLSFDLVMQALGRVPNVENLNLDLAEVKLDKSSSIIVDKFFKTSAKDIYAIGDVINRVQLTPVAIAEAMNLVNNFFRKKKIVFNYKNIPTAVFANPNYAFIGLTEEEAKKKIDKVDVFVSKFRPLKYSLSDINEKVFIKLLVNRSNDKVIGLHYLGENAAEIIQGFAVAIVKGLKKEDFDKTIGIHPSSAEEIVTMKNKT